MSVASQATIFESTCCSGGNITVDVVASQCCVLVGLVYVKRERERKEEIKRERKSTTDDKT